jgi:hypothetical protein
MLKAGMPRSLYDPILSSAFSGRLMRMQANRATRRLAYATTISPSANGRQPSEVGETLAISVIACASPLASTVTPNPCKPSKVRSHCFSLQAVSGSGILGMWSAIRLASKRRTLTYIFAAGIFAVAIYMLARTGPPPWLSIRRERQ